MFSALRSSKVERVAAEVVCDESVWLRRACVCRARGDPPHTRLNSTHLSAAHTELSLIMLQIYTFPVGEKREIDKQEKKKEETQDQRQQTWRAASLLALHFSSLMSLFVP